MKIQNLKATFLIVAITAIGEIYSYYKNLPVVYVDWFYAWNPPFPFTKAWAVKCLCEEINWILWAIAGYYVATYKGDQSKVIISIKVAIIWRIGDLILFFYNYKQFGYWYWLIAIGLIEFVWHYFNDKKLKLVK